MELNVTTRKSFNEILDKQIKRYSKKGWNLWNNTRFDFKIKKTAPLKQIVVVQNA